MGEPVEAWSAGPSPRPSVFRSPVPRLEITTGSPGRDSLPLRNDILFTSRYMKCFSVPMPVIVGEMEKQLC